MPDEFIRWQFYFTQNPQGQKILLGVAVVLGLAAILVGLKTMRWAAARWRELAGAAIVLAGLFYLATWVLNFGLLGMVVAGMMCFGMFVGLALFLTHR